MFLEVDPGRRASRCPRTAASRRPTPRPTSTRTRCSRALDTDTRDYLKLLISGAGKGLKGRGTDLQETFARLGPAEPRPRPAHQGRRAPAQEPHEPGEQVRHAHDASWAPRTARSCGWCGRRTRCSRRSPPRTPRSPTPSASCRARWADRADAGEGGHARRRAGPGAARRCARRSASSTPPTRRCCRSCARPRRRSATRSGRSRASPAPYTADLGTAARDLNKAAPDLTTSFNKLNRFFNIGAFNPNGAEGLTGDLARDRARQEGYLYWLAWTAQNTVSLFSTADAQGPLRRIFLGGLGCDALTGGRSAPADVVALARLASAAQGYAPTRWSRRPPARSASPRW